jgi:hypothetical protein
LDNVAFGRWIHQLQNQHASPYWSKEWKVIGYPPKETILAKPLENPVDISSWGSNSDAMGLLSRWSAHVHKREMLDHIE